MTTLKPIHSKQGFVYVNPYGTTDGTSGVGDVIVSSIQDFSLNIAPQFEATATVAGSDVVIDTETQAFLARVSFTSLFTETEVLTMLQTTTDTLLTNVDDTVTADYTAAISEYLGNETRVNILKSDFVFYLIVSEDTTGTKKRPDSITEGIIVEVRELSVTGFEVTYTQGEYVNVRVEGMSGKFKVVGQRLQA